MEALIFWLLVAAGITFFIRRSKKAKKAEQAALDAAPEQPFKVNVAITPIKDNALLKIVRGRPLTHMLEMDIQISPKDWQRIKDAGLYDAVLFEYPDETSTTSGELSTCHVRGLRQKIGVCFYNIGDAERAKEALLQSLHNLKDAITLQKEGKRTESFEI